MTDRFQQVRAAVLALLMVTSLFAVANVATGAPGDPDSYAVTQGGECWEVTAMGDGTQSVEDFYDYRSPETTPSSPYFASFGTEHFQENQVSQLFVYNGSEGVSLVMLHDKLGDGPNGSTTTFHLSGLPESRDWALEDDTYENRDDEFLHGETESTIHWKWASNRTDGAAVRGLADTSNYTAIEIQPRFNQDAEYWGNWGYSGDEANETKAWKLITEPSSESVSSPGSKVELDRSQNLTIEQGTCETDDSPPSAALSAQPTTVEAGDQVSLDAGSSSDDGQIVEYRWDFDDDGTIDASTSGATTTHSYDQLGEHNPSVTVVDAGGNSDTANATVTVTDNTPPVVQLNAPSTVPNGSEFVVDASDSTDNGRISSYEWDFGDGNTSTDATTSHKYGETGDFEITLTVTDEAGNSNSTTTTVTVSDEYQKPRAALDAPESTDVGTDVTFDASGSEADREIVEYHWWFDDDGKVDAVTENPTITYAYETAGDYEAAVMVVDETENADVATTNISVSESPGEEPPNAVIDAPSETHVEADFTVDASASSDPDGQIVSYEWDFGDGKTGANGKNVTYAYDGTGGGTYTITLTVTDDDGNKDTASKKISVGDNPPNFGIKTHPSSGTVDAGEKIWVSAEPHGDDDGIDDYHFEWGDGTVTEKSEGPLWKGGHVYSEPGTYDVRVTVTDTMGQSVSKNVTLTITDPNAGNGGSGGGDDGDDSNNNNGGNTGGGNTGGSDTGDSDPKTDVDDSQDGVHVNVDDAKGNEPLTVELPSETETGDGLAAYESITVTLIDDGDYEMTIGALDEPPEGVNSPTVESDGFEPLSYLVVDHPDLSDDEIDDAAFTFTIQQSRLDALDADAHDVQIYRYDDGSWSTVDTEVVEETDGTIRFRANDGDLSMFAVAIDRPAIALSDLSVSQDSIAPGESVDITATIGNDGWASDVTAVDFGVDGETVDTRKITLSAKSERSITFEQTFSEPGTYTISVNGEEAAVVVQSETTETPTATPDETPDGTPATPDDGQPGFGLVLSALALLGAALLALRRR